MTETSVLEHPPKTSRLRWRTITFVLLFTTATFCAGWAWRLDRRYKNAMAEVESQVVGERYAGACRNLRAMLTWSSDRNGGIHYLLGSCELARGRKDLADDAWSRVTPGSEFSERAIRGRMRLLHDAGQITAAERLIVDAAADPRNDPTSLMVALVPIAIDLGRAQEAAHLIENRWNHLNSLHEGALDPAIKLLLQHIDVTTKAPPVEAVRNLLDQAAKLAPNDERIWLGRANLAIRTGNHEDANRWLAACEQRSAGDLAVVRARLDWGIATDQPQVVQQILDKHPDAESTDAERLKTKAWLARHRGDTVVEVRTLEKLIAVDPAATSALERLADLARMDRQPDTAANWLAKKTESERVRARYLTLHDRKQPIRDAEELANLANQLGRKFEERGFLTIAVWQEPGRNDLKQRLRTLDRLPKN